EKEIWAGKAWGHLESVRRTAPLVQCITNFVSMDIVANVLLSAGASPAMIHSIEEIRDFTPAINVLYINIGTLSPEWLPAMKLAAGVANNCDKPWVLDPVAAGATGFRLKACLELLELKPTVVRGNASEILALYRGSVEENHKGVDSTHESTTALSAAKFLAQKTGCVVAVSGEVDIVTDGDRVLGAKNGVSMLRAITAAGCSVTALIAAFVSVDPMHPLDATATALSIFGLAAEKAMEVARGPASLRMHLIDAIHRLKLKSVVKRVSIT
ncbi:hypothetical protein M569_16793, partial [Genlisea aurea]